MGTSSCVEDYQLEMASEGSANVGGQRYTSRSIFDDWVEQILETLSVHLWLEDSFGNYQLMCIISILNTYELNERSG